MLLRLKNFAKREHESFVIKVQARYIFIAWCMFTESKSHYLNVSYHGVFSFYRNLIPSKDCNIYNEDMVILDGIASLYFDKNGSFEDNLSCIMNLYLNMCHFHSFKVLVEEMIQSFDFNIPITHHIATLNDHGILKYLSNTYNRSRFFVKLSVKSRKKGYSLKFTQYNVQILSLFFIRILFKNDTKLNLELNYYHEESKQYNQSIQDVLFNVLCFFDQGITGLFSFHDVDYNSAMKSYMLNLTFVIDLVLKNRRCIQIIMNNETIWKLVMNFIGQLFSSPHIMEPRRMKLMASVLKVLAFWTKEQAVYFLKSRFMRDLVTAMVNICSNDKQSKNKTIVIAYIIRIIITLDRIYALAVMDYGDGEHCSFAKLFINDLQTISRNKYKKLKN